MTFTEVRQWDPFRAELADTIRGMKHNLPKRPCLYCGAVTKSVFQVCMVAHSDLPSLDEDLAASANEVTT